MAGPTSLRQDLAHPLAERLLSFNFLPSRWLHPSRVASLAPPGWDSQVHPPPSILHRHWSASLLREVGPGALVSLDEPAAPLCLASDALFEALTLHAGLLVLAPAVRRLITRSEVADIAGQVGVQAVAFARHAAKALRTGDESPPLAPAHCRAQAQRLGDALLSLAFDTAQPALAARARLRLPADAAVARSDLPSELADSRAAMVACRAVLRYLEPQWLSSFPDRH